MIGNLTKDPDYKQQQSGQAVCRLSLASNRQFRNKQTGAMVQEVCYIDVDVWGAQADNCRQYLQKGRPVLVEGRIKLDVWESEGQTRRKHLIVADRVVFLGSGQATADSDDAMLSPAVNAQSKFGSDNGSSTRRAKSNDSDFMLEELGNETQFKDEPPFGEDLPF